MLLLVYDFFFFSVRYGLAFVFLLSSEFLFSRLGMLLMGVAKDGTGKIPCQMAPIVGSCSLVVVHEGHGGDGGKGWDCLNTTALVLGAGMGMVIA